MPQNDQHHSGHHRERTESSCSSGYGSCSSNSHRGRDHHRKSPQRNKNNQNRPGSAGHPKPLYPAMTLICHRVDLFDDFVPSRCDPNNAESVSVLVPVRCMGVNGGCACRTPCTFCHALIEDDVMEVDTQHTTREAPADLHPGFAFLFAGGNTEAEHKQNEEVHHQNETTVRNLSIDPIFAHNHGLIPDGAGEGAVKMKRFHHPPVGKYKYTAPLAELPAFFSGDSGAYDSKPAEQKTFDSDAQADNGGGLDSFFDDFVTTAPPPKEAVKPDSHQDHNTLILRTPTKTVVKTVISSSDNLTTVGKCICQARHDNLKKGAIQPNPHDPSVVHDKYWAQRRRLFKKFDEGIQLDAEGWYSVTPEVVADHVGSRFIDAAGSLSQCSNATTKHNGKGKGKKQSKPMVILDAFCGCGGNAIAFAKLPASVVSIVVCIDVDRTKLRKAAHNASIYNIPPHRIVFVEANSVAVMERCYRDGVLVMDPPPRTAAALSQYPPREIYDDFTIGGIDLLTEYAPRIDAIFMDPPWGGMDYGATGKDGYDLARDMKIRGCERGCVGFPPTPEIDGFRLLKIAAAATSTRFVMYDLPRNANKRSLAEAALEAGYEGNCKLEEHYLNGRLKTVTAYFGQDFSKMLDSKPDLV